jgi:predicted dehydrogenase
MNDAAVADGERGVRYGLIGCGDIGVVRAAALERGPSSLAAVSDIDASKAGAIAQRAGVPADSDWRRLLERADVDAVIVATPPSLHAEMCIAAFEAGKHVLCEKPLARSAAECREIVDAAQTAGLVIATGFNYRFYPSFMLARQILDSGRIGRLSHIRAYAGYSAVGHNQPWVHDAAVVGGGALHDNGIHLIDLVRHFLGEVEEVKGWATDHVWGYGRAEDNGYLLLRGPEDRVATVHASWSEWEKYQFRIELVGTLGKITSTCFPMRTDVTWAESTGGRTRSRTDRFLSTMVGEHVRSYRWVVARSFVHELAAFDRKVAGLSSPVATGMDGLRAIEIACAAEHLGAADVVGTRA